MMTSLEVLDEKGALHFLTVPAGYAATWWMELAEQRPDRW